MASKLSIFFAELKRRKVTRVAVVYILVGVGVVEGADIIGSPLGLPDWVLPALSPWWSSDFPSPSSLPGTTARRDGNGSVVLGR